MELFVIVVLCGLLIFQYIFSMRQQQILINKIMSRNYFEYQQAQIPPEPVKKFIEQPEEPMDLRALNDLLAPP